MREYGTNVRSEGSVKYKKGLSPIPAQLACRLWTEVGDTPPEERVWVGRPSARRQGCLLMSGQAQGEVMSNWAH